MLILETEDDIKPLVAAAVEATLAAIQTDEERLPDRLAFSEADAARLLGLETHQLRDERLRGRLAFTKVVGGRVRYLRSDLLEYLNRQRETSRV